MNDEYAALTATDTWNLLSVHQVQRSLDANRSFV